MTSTDQKIHLYCIPGLGASTSIFEFIKLPEIFEIHLLPWQTPYKDDTIQSYAQRMCNNIKHDNVILLGVSFGGIMAQEISKIINTKKVIIVSSVKSKYELPKRLQIIRDTKLYKILPTGLLEKVNNWENLVFGETNKKIAKAYEKYLNVMNKQYLDWAIENVLHWKQEEALENIIHIHGSKDHVFPIENIKNPIIIKNATHAAILRRSKWFNEHLPAIIKDKACS